jgi:hypothetical protein
MMSTMIAGLQIDRRKGCPRISIFLRPRHFKKISAAIYIILRALFFRNNAELGKKDILGQPPRRNLSPYPLSSHALKSLAAIAKWVGM